MPPSNNREGSQKTVVGGLAKKLGDRLRKAHDAVKDNETQVSGFAELPAGIENGIARLTKCGFSVYKTGEMTGKDYFRAEGRIVSPAEFAGMKIEGQVTSIMEPLCDTPNSAGKRRSFEEHLDHIENHLRLLGGDTSSVDATEIELVAQSLEEDGPFFRFRTWKGAKQTTGPYKDQEPRVQHTWLGACDAPEGYGDDAGGGVADNSPEPPVKPTTRRNAAVAEPPPSKAPAKASPKTASPPKAPLTEDPPAEFDEFADLNGLVQRAEDGEEEAMNKLEEMALANGFNRKQVKDAGSWSDVADMAATKPDAGGGDEAPVVGDVYDYTVYDKQKKKDVSISVNVLSIDEDSKTADLQNLTNPKVKYTGIGWDKLSK